MASLLAFAAKYGMNALFVGSILGGMASGGYMLDKQQKSACGSVNDAYTQMTSAVDATRKAMGPLQAMDEKLKEQMHELAVGLAHNYREISDVADRGRTLLMTLQIALGTALALVCVLLVMKRLHLLRRNPFRSEEEEQAEQKARAQEKRRRALEKRLRKPESPAERAAFAAVLADPRFEARSRGDALFVDRLLDDDEFLARVSAAPDPVEVAFAPLPAAAVIPQPSP